MKSTLIALASLILLTLSGCQTSTMPAPSASRAPGPAARMVPFNEADFIASAAKGTSSVTGQAFMKTRGGDVKFGAGCEVRMVPVNAYTSEVWERSKLGIVLAEPDPRYFKYRRTTMADGSGNFEFKNVPAGSYYLSCTITWQVPGVYALRSTGGTGMAKAEVGEGETVRVLVTAP